MVIIKTVPVTLNQWLKWSIVLLTNFSDIEVRLFLGQHDLVRSDWLSLSILFKRWQTTVCSMHGLNYIKPPIKFIISFIEYGTLKNVYQLLHHRNNSFHSFILKKIGAIVRIDIILSKRLRVISTFWRSEYEYRKHRHCQFFFSKRAYFTLRSLESTPVLHSIIYYRCNLGITTPHQLTPPSPL